jgi:hypothetical protein
MIKHKPFLRWFLFAMLTSVGIFFVGREGFFETLLERDFTNLSFVILVLFGWVSAVMGLRIRKVGAWVKTRNGVYDRKGNLVDPVEVKEFSTIAWFVAALSMKIGMTGTVWGFIAALIGFMGIDINDPVAAQSGMSHMISGVMAALYTTFVGLVCSLFIVIQAYHLDFSIREKK